MVVYPSLVIAMICGFAGALADNVPTVLSQGADGQLGVKGTNRHATARMVERSTDPGGRSSSGQAASRNARKAGPRESASGTRVVDQYGQLPLHFEPNRGQAGPEARFVARGAGYALALDEGGATFALRDAPPLRLNFLGARRSITLEGLDKQVGKSNYLGGNNPAHFLTDIPHYGRVRAGRLYPGIDLVYYGAGKSLEFDFIVEPGADPGLIHMSFDGQRGLLQDPNGDLILSVGGGEVRVRLPMIYQEEHGTRRKIQGAYRVEDGDVRFSVGPYDIGRALVIDPVLEYSTYLGGSGADVGYAIAVDGTGHAYVAGSTDSPDFPRQSPYQAALPGKTSAFISKLNPAGTALVYSTYFGGTVESSSAQGPAFQAAYGIAVDASGAAYVTGETDARDFPTTAGAYKTTLAGCYVSAFATKLNPAGSGLAYSTLVCGAVNRTYGRGIAIDGTGAAYITGSTSDHFFPTTANAFQRAYFNNDDVFVTKLNPAGTALAYSTLIGKNDRETGNGIAVDALGNAYITGTTNTTTGPDFPTVNPVVPTAPCPGFCGYAFVAKVNPTGTALDHSTLLGGDRAEGKAIALGASGTIFVGGKTGNAAPTGLLTAIDAAGQRIVFSTYIGGQVFGVAAMPDGVAIVGAGGPSIPLVQPVEGRPGPFAALVSTSGSLLFATYIGGNLARAVAADPSGSLYITGSTGSNLLVTPSALQATPGSTSDAFVLKINSGPSCEYVLNPQSLVFPTEGGPGSVGISGPSACLWRATTAAEWITLTTIPPTYGSGAIAFQVAQNSSTASRLAAISLTNGQSIMVYQAGTTGTCTIQPTSLGATINASFDPTDCEGPYGAGDLYSFSASAGQQIAIEIEAPRVVTYLHLYGPDGVRLADSLADRVPATGYLSLLSTGLYYLHVSASTNRENVYPAYTLRLQTPGSSNCSIQLSPASHGIPAGGGRGSIMVSAPAGCRWSAYLGSFMDHVSIVSGASGSGPGVVAFRVAPNTGSARRSGNIVVANQELAIVQDGANCTYSLASSGAAYPSAGGSGPVSVLAPSGCGWSTDNRTDWITIAGFGSGAGNGAVTYLVAPNVGVAPRTGTFAINGRPFTVIQGGTNPAPVLSVFKSHSGNFTAGQTGAAYNIVVTNLSSVGTTDGTITVTESLPAGLTLVAMTGPGWICGGAVCARGDALSPGGSYPPITVSVNVSLDAATPQVNTVTVSGGGSASAKAIDVTTIVTKPSWIISKSHSAVFTRGQTGLPYTITVENSPGVFATSGAVTVRDTPSPGLTLVSLSGNGWNCSGATCTRGDSLSPGAAYPPITATVNVAPNAVSQEWNTAGVSGGGAPEAATATDPTLVYATTPLSASDLYPGVAKLVGINGSFLCSGFRCVVWGGTYRIPVSDEIQQMVVKVEQSFGYSILLYGRFEHVPTLSGGSILRDFVAEDSAVTLTRDGSTGSLKSGTYYLSTAAFIPPGLTQVSGGAYVTIHLIKQASALGISVAHTGNFTQGQTGATYVLTVNNAASAAPTSGTVTVTEDLPTGMTLVSMAGNGWICLANSCSRSDVLAPGASYPPITVTVNVAANAGSPLVNMVTVSGGGSASATATDSTVIDPKPAQLSITKTHFGNFTQGQTGATYTVAVSNGGSAGPTSGTVTVTESAPSGLTVTSMAGTGWSCGASTCSRSDALMGGASYPPITVMVNVAANATSPQVNTVSVSGGGSAGASASDSTIIVIVPPVLSIAKTHSGNFTQGQTGAVYTVVVSNAAGAGPISGIVTVTESAPSGLTVTSMAGTGWSCGATTCSRSDALTGGASYPAITVAVNVAANASSPQVNTVSVSGGGSASASASDPTIIVTVPPVLSIAKSHSGIFVRGQTGATYTVVVSNGAGAGPTSGTVTVTESAPSGLTVTSMSGTGWSCAGGTCSRSDALSGGASYPPITVTVNVAANASSPQVNTVSVSGGGSASASASDPTIIVIVPPVLSIAKSHSGSFLQGQTGATYTVAVSNGAAAGPTSGTVTVTESAPSGLTVTSMSGTGWSCAGGTCSRSDALSGGASYPPITVTVNVAANASSPQVNTVSVSGGGSASSSASDSTVIVPSTFAIRINAGGGAYTEPGTGIGWSADGHFSGGYPYATSQPIANTATPGLYQSERWASGTLQYQFNDIPAGKYSLKLKFAEIYFTAVGSRVFRIVVNGQTVEAAMDVVARAGGGFRAYDVVYPVVVSGGQITVQLIGVVENPKINSIEITDSGPVSASLSISKTHGGNFIQGQTGATYAVMVANAPGADPTSGPVTVTENVPAGLTLVSMSGTGWSCGGSTCTRSDALNGGSSYPPITVTVNVAANATSPLVNTAGVSGGGSAGATASDSTIITPVAPASLSVTKTHSGNFTQGQTGAVYTVVVSNAAGAGTTSGTVTVTDSVPPGLSLASMSGTGWSCAGNTCTRSSVLNGGASYPPITVTVNVAANATSPQVNTVIVSGGGSASASATDSTVVVTNGFIRVNAGGGAYTEPGTGIVWNADTGFTGGYLYATNQPIANTSTPGLYQSERWASGALQYQFNNIPAGNYSVKLKFAEIYFTTVRSRVFRIVVNGQTVEPAMDVVARAGGGFRAYDVVYPVVVSGGQITVQLIGVVENPKINAIEITGGDVVVPSLSITKSHSGDFTQGQTGAAYTVVVSNGTGAGPTSGPVTVTENAPSGLTLMSMSGTGWSCGGNTCTRSDALNGGSSYPPITVTVNVASNASSPQVNTVSVSGGGSAGASATDSTVVTNGIDPIRVNAGGAAYTEPGTGIVWSADTGFTGGYPYATNQPIANTTTPGLYQSERWASGTLQYQFNNILPGSYSVKLKFAEIYFTTVGSRVFRIVVNGQTVETAMDVVARAGGGFRAYDVVYPVVVSGGQITVQLIGVVENPKINAIEITGSGVVPPPLSIAKTHSGNFTQGQTGAVYTVVVSRAPGAGPASGTVTVTEALPSGLTLVSMSGAGWSCGGNACTRGDTLNAGSSYPPITVTVNVAANASSPQVNTVSVSGGGTAGATASDSTIITPVAAASLSVTKTHNGNFTQGQTGAVYTVVVSNAAGAGPSSGTVTVTETVPAGLTLVSMSGTGWSCAGNTCTRSSVLNGGASYPPITVTVNVAANATSPQVNTVSVSGGGSAGAGATDSTVVTNGSVPIRVNAGGAAYTEPGPGIVWSADSNFSGGYPYATSQPIANTSTPGLYQSERWTSGTLQYQFNNIPAGNYSVKLKFAEIYLTTAGSRVFRILVNGQTVETAMDVVARAGGGFRAYDVVYPVAVNGGQITIQLIGVVENPKVNAIEITAQ